MHRLAIPLVALLVCSCNTPDAAFGVDGAPESDASEGASRSIAVTRVDLGTLGGASSYAADINAGNTVVGWSETIAGETHAFRWNATDGMVDLGTLPGDATSRAVAVLDSDVQGGGRILGVSGDNSRWTPVVWSMSGAITALPIPLLPSFTIAGPTGFNSRGDVVGSDAGGLLADSQHGWIWSNADGKYDLSGNVQGGSNEGAASAVNSSGIALLTTRAHTCTRSAQCWRVYLWTQTIGYRAIGTPGGDPEAHLAGLDLNESGTVVGWVALNATSNLFPYRWVPGAGFTLLANYAPEGSSYGYATALNAKGTVVGAAFEPASGSIVASTWLANGRIAKLSPDDPNPSVAIAINNPGTIAGWAVVANGVAHAVIWTPSLGASPIAIPSQAYITPRATTGSSRCLADARSITSRQALFSCVIKADRKR